MTRLIAILALAMAALTGGARAETSDEDLRRLLATPGVHAIMRHALAPGTSDPAGFRVNDCATQRNLDGRGRAQARATGDRLRALGARFTQVRTSQWCRCKDTADLLALGAPVEDLVLNSFFDDRSTAGSQTQALAAYLKALPPGEKVMLVTHQVNITALTRRGVSSGEIYLIRMGAEQAEVLGSLIIDP
ncbi:MAG: histidine phosphatase family protein [Pseudomonadota bacterium]